MIGGEPLSPQPYNPFCTATTTLNPVPQVGTHRLSRPYGVVTDSLLVESPALSVFKHTTVAVLGIGLVARSHFALEAARRV